jgi:hypothetical protein
MMPNVFDPERVSKISKIMPQFSDVAKVGDEVHMGLVGDPAFPYQDGARPVATVSSVEKHGENVQINLAMEDGTTKKVDKYTISPDGVWEFTDESFKNVLQREREAFEMRAEARMQPRKEEISYRGIDAANAEIQKLRAELQAEKELVRNFHNTYIASLSELASDICKLDTDHAANFCRTFKAEYEKMVSRPETSYRGNEDAAEDSMSSDDENSLVSDYF